MGRMVVFLHLIFHSMNKKVLYFQTKFLAEEKEDVIKIKGFASTPDRDRQNDIVLPTAFSESLPTYLKIWHILLSHDKEKVIGSPTSAEIKSNGLEIEAEIKYDTDGCMERIRKWDLNTFSIGFITEAYQYEDKQGHILYKSDEGIMAGYTWDDIYADDVVRVITKLDLAEISVVSVPANPFAMFQVAKMFFTEETKALKSLSTQQKWAPNEWGDWDNQEEPNGVETEQKEGEQPTGESPAEVTPNPTGEEATTGESPETPEEKSIEGTAPEGEEASSPESGDEEPTDTPTGVTEDEVKALIAEAVEKVSKELSLAFEQKLVTLSSENAELKAFIAKVEEKSAQIEKDVLKIEVPRGSTRTQWVKRIVLTDEMVLKTIGQ